MQVDWGHFGSLTYGNTARKLYALAVVEAFSRRLYVHFTHSQNQAALHQGLLEAFLFFNGTPDELLVDNMLTAVREREGALIRFNENFLDFLRPFKIRPRACNPGAPQEKGKIERSLQYLRHNFWPLRSFADLGDVQRQVRQWLEQVANERIHQTTGEKPSERFKADHPAAFTAVLARLPRDPQRARAQGLCRALRCQYLHHPALVCRQTPDPQGRSEHGHHLPSR